MRGLIWKLGWLGVAACGFQPTEGSGPVDSHVDTTPPIDVPFGTPKSCQELHLRTPAMPSGQYMIDPDGDGGDAPVLANCDMTTAGGGWTIVFVALSVNIAPATSAYSPSSKKLRDDAGQTLIAYRDSNLVAATDYATFNVPSDWRNDLPFNFPGNDFATPVSVNGGAAGVATVRYGYGNYGNICTDVWSSTTTLGRVCVTGTRAPFFTAWADPSVDNCNNSLMNWDSTPCTDNHLFSIAVR